MPPTNRTRADRRHQGGRLAGLPPAPVAVAMPR